MIDTGHSPIISLDLNNDYFPDLITHHSNNIGVLHNLQDNTFSEEEIVQSFDAPYSIHPIKVDYNNDGFMDLIVINNDDDAYVLLNNQTGGLEPAQFVISVGHSNSIYKVDDFDSDGNLDIYIREGDYLKIYIQSDFGAFYLPSALQIYSSLESYGILDLDENGVKDILYYNNAMIRAKYFYSNGNINGFSEINDLMVTDRFSFYSSYNHENSIYIENEGNGIYAAYIALETSPSQLDIYKFNIQNNVFSDPVVVLSNFGVNTFGAKQFNFIDLNNDDNLDFSFSTNFNENKMIFINNDINDSPDKTICIQQLIRPSNFSVIDMNGDGSEDICIGTQNGLGFFDITPDNELSGLRHLIGVVSNPNASTYTINHITDFNNDGLGDVIDFTSFKDHAKIYKNLGNDNFEFIQSLSLANNFTTNIYFVDIDSDGLKDLLFLSFDIESPDISLFHWSKNNNGVGFNNLQSLIINSTENISPVSLAFDDFNNDNQVDILLLSYYHENGEWKTEMNLLINNNGEFSGNSVALFSGSYGRSHLKIHDFDQDGDLDFFVYNINDNQYRDFHFLFFKNNGDNTFESIIIENMNIEDIEFADNDGDGFYEIYAWNYDDSSNNIFYYITTDYVNFHRIEIDSYSASYDSNDPYTRGDLLLYDYNNDGKDDLFIDNLSAFNGLISVYKNNSVTLGVEEIENDNNLNKLRVYPNPFVSSISWSNQENKIYNLQLYSQNGKLVFEKTTSKNSLDLSNFTNGIYFFVMKREVSGHLNVYKIIKK
ncbi:MAG: hypothetical protein ACI83H_001324 [Glaciecola sp.]